MNNPLTLTELGWRPHFQAQLDLDELEQTVPMRVIATHRGELDLLGTEQTARLIAADTPAFDWSDQPTAGDWLLVERDDGMPRRLLERFSLVKRRAAGLEHKLQLIAANIDTIFITTSCNADFKPARLERYLALALASDVQPVILLTKADLAQDPARFYEQAQALMPDLMVEMVDARAMDAGDRLAAWTGPGQTVALVGSSGVGKSTLVNTLTGEQQQATAGIREDDAKGRHTTTGRTMHRLLSGGWLLDTPGMRELRMADAIEGIDALFDDLLQLAANCRFADCAHESEPGCAIQAEITSGRLDSKRLERARKLWREERAETETVHERRQRMRGFTKIVKSTQSVNRSRKGRD